MIMVADKNYRQLRRGRRFAIATTFVAIFVCAVSRAAENAPQSAEASRPPSDSVVRMIFVGDVMLTDEPGKAVAAGVDLFAPFNEIFHDADLVVGNLECVIATTGKPVERKPWTFRADPRCVNLLAKHFHAVSLANNHSGDFGKGALVECLDRLDGKLAYFGAGRNLDEAHRPRIVERGGLRIALLGYNEFHPREFEAGEKSPGVAWSVDERVIADVRAAREKADLVIPFMHWGEEEELAPNERQRTLARKMIDAGASLVVGAHPHVTQGAEYYRGKLIVYSLGNFVFDGFATRPTKTGWILRFSLNKNGLIAWNVLTVTLGDEGLPSLDPLAAGLSGGAGEATMEMRRISPRESF